ncbi:DUF2189 domain-containing protein [Sulfitobacter sp. D35]|uniref:DUF2189 domain-containing protein n=1 Tax=Sulfitobacter sp. D35 TaxID=3083252 RepID=UPI00296FB5FF|nr:DUF2189 domain-containing protein [Sulfitobacter sp. D35]MDW4498605.1 DUF2189 domain-containing protein [Sulfitobacter sp. D35]
MAKGKTIGNPLSWAAKAAGSGSTYIGEGTSELGSHDTAPIELNDLSFDDLRTALKKGAEDFMALRTDVVFVVLIYPIIGLLLIWAAVNREVLPLVFPMITGFAILGPVAAIGLYEMSRRREQGLETNIGDAFGVMGSPSFVPIVVLGCYLAFLFAMWLVVAWFLYGVTLGPEPPQSASALIGDVFTTGSGWVMLILGSGIGFIFAVAALAMSLVSFPLLIDRHVGLTRAVVTSATIARRNPVEVAAWGAIVVAMLVLGVATLFIGMIIVLPILGHATWHLYRCAVARRPR